MDASSPFQPRKVDPDPYRRWAQAAAALIGRSPLAFVALLAALLLVDWALCLVAAAWPGQASAVLRDGISGLGAPFVFATGVAVARFADRWKPAALKAAAPRLAVISAVLVVIAVLTRLSTPEWFSLREASQAHGPFMRWLCWSWALTIVPLGFFVIPLLALAGAPMLQAWELSHDATTLNHLRGDVLWIIGLPVAVGVLPPFGIPGGVLIVFLAAVQYVAYRDVFEHRADNFPRTAAVAAPATAPQPEAP